MLLFVPSVKQWPLVRALLPAHEPRTSFCSYYLQSVLFDFARIILCGGRYRF
jgi:hypothetical protein